jgi:hypothetical protein
MISDDPIPILAIPLYGLPCAHCGHPARSLRVLPERRVTAHETSIPNCENAAGNAEKLRDLTLPPAAIRPAAISTAKTA